MTGTDLSVADVDLGAFTGGGDAAQDTVVVNGTDRPDNVKVNRSEDQVVTTGLRTQTRIANSESLNDTLRVNTLAGDDRVTVDPNAELLITPVIDLGRGRLVDPRTTSRVGSHVLPTGSPRSRASSVLAAATPISCCGIATVVSGGWTRSTSGMSLCPVTETSSGQRRPAAASAA